MTISRIIVVFVASLLAFGATSCSHKNGPTLYTVKGSAVFEGAPAAGAVLTFHRVGDSDKTNLPHAVVAADGSFALTTITPGDGAAPGKYAVTVIWRKKKSKVKGDDDEGAWMLPLRYLTADQSGLTAEVKDGPTELSPFILKK